MIEEDNFSGWRWTVGGILGRFGWWFVDIGAAIAWKDSKLLPWRNK